MEVHSRQNKEPWPTRAFGADEMVVLPSLGIQLAGASIYEDVDPPLA